MAELECTPPHVHRYVFPRSFRDLDEEDNEAPTPHQRQQSAMAGGADKGPGNEGVDGGVLATGRAEYQLRERGRRVVQSHSQ